MARGDSDAVFDISGSAQAKPEMLTLVRESRGLTQAEVAERMSKFAAVSPGTAVSQGYVSRAEKGRLAVMGERLELYAQALECVPDLLCLDPQVADVGIGLVHHRKKAALSAPALRRIHGQLVLTRLHVQRLLEASGQSADGSDFLQFTVDDANRPYDAAAAVRNAWGIPPGPVCDLIGWIERAGGVVLLRDLESDHLDAVSQWPSGRGPLILVNTRAPGDRLRFSIAHELGHLTMHEVPGETAEQERQADEFASALLMPASDIRDELADGVDLARLMELKQRWKVSMSALLRRAQTLREISEWQYRTIMIEMSALGYRTSEPVAFQIDGPTTVRECARRATELVTVGELARCMYLSPEDLRRDYADDLDSASDEETTRIPRR